MASKARQSSYIFVRIAGLSGFTAVCCGAYGAHVLKPQADKEHEYVVYQSANKYHFIHTVTLLAMPFVKRPMLCGSLFTAGMVTFSGIAYYYAFTSDPRPVKLMPYGGALLMLGWLALVI